MPLAWSRSTFVGLASLLFPAAATHAQGVRPLAQTATTFWSLDAATGVVLLDGHSHLVGETPEQSAQHVRQWLTAYFPDWSEFNPSDSSKLFFSTRMRRLHAGVELKFQVGIKFEKNGFRYVLTKFRIGCPTGAGIMQWHDLNRVLNDSDFRVDIEQFQEELEQAMNRL